MWCWRNLNAALPHQAHAPVLSAASHSSSSPLAWLQWLSARLRQRLTRASDSPLALGTWRSPPSVGELPSLSRSRRENDGREVRGGETL